MSANFPGIKDQLTDLMVTRLFEELGLTPYLLKDACSFGSSGWSKGERLDPLINRRFISVPMNIFEEIPCPLM